MRGQSMLITLVTLCTLFTLVTAAHNTLKHHGETFSNKKTMKKSNIALSSNIYGKHRLISYVVDWEIPKTINWDQMDHVAYAFAEPNESGALESYSDSNLKSLVTEAHRNKVGVSISIGGWSGSKYFSLLVASDSKVKILVSNIMAMIDKFSLDGVNLDWEYPNDPNGVSCNIKNPKDTANYLVFIQALRKALDAKYSKVHKLITLAVGTNPFNDENQNPTKSLDSGWAKAVDSFYLMTYDISGSWMKQAGPNAPLNKAGSDRYDSSVIQSVQAWKSAGIPSKQLVVGIPFYGAALKTSRAINSASGLYVKLASPSAIKGDQYDELSADACSGAKKSYSGSFQWRSIVSAGVMNDNNGWKNYWDKVSATPYAFLAKQKKFLSFDDPQSLKDKADYVNQQNLGGAMIWSLEMDDAKNTLLTSMQSVRN